MTTVSSNRPWFFEHAALGCASLLILEQHSRLPAANPLVLLPCGFLIAAIGCSYLARLVVRLSNDDLDRHEGSRSIESFSCRLPALRCILNWLVFPTAMALLMSSAATHWPASVRFALSRSSFEQLVSDAHQGKELKGFPRRVGLYWIESAYDYDFNYATRQGTIGFVTGSCLIDECGLYYDQQNFDSTHWLTTRIAPCWYVTEW